ncbi:hypothetical protein CN606_17695 [Bacillus toyonensis]|uniref:hypothetical protein n=1 Tax=Bacillus toyonensis TaxID=155322 RepID=UPI000BF14EBD|nr:hypothetical protein [Bacillus toyonensis]PEL01328.1 hypothetical protein CN606_17695 [Bacillus toyonensis]
MKRVKERLLHLSEEHTNWLGNEIKYEQKEKEEGLNIPEKFYYGRACGAVLMIESDIEFLLSLLSQEERKELEEDGFYIQWRHEVFNN